MFADLREAKTLWAPAAPLMLTSLFAVWVPTPIAIEVRARKLSSAHWTPGLEGSSSRSWTPLSLSWLSRSHGQVDSALESRQESVDVSIMCF
jgi:hypothetical protein